MIPQMLTFSSRGRKRHIKQKLWMAVYFKIFSTRMPIFHQNALQLCIWASEQEYVHRWMLSWIIFASKCRWLKNIKKGAFSFGFRKSCGQVLSALIFFTKQDLYYANIIINNFAASYLHCFYVLNILIGTAYKSVISDMSLFGAWN